MGSMRSSAADGFRTALDLFEIGVEVMCQNLRRAHPDASSQDIEERLLEWLHERPGAESGDCPGRVVRLSSDRA
jgi:hypothetical protein